MCMFCRVLEAVLIVMVTTVCIFLTATLLGTCVQERADDGEEKNCPGLTVKKEHITWAKMELFHGFISFQGDLTFRNETRGYFCPNSVPPYYNDMATLVFNSQETAIKQLFHQSGKQPSHVTVTWQAFWTNLTITPFTQVPSPSPPSGLSSWCTSLWPVGRTELAFLAVFSSLVSWLAPPTVAS